MKKLYMKDPISLIIEDENLAKMAKKLKKYGIKRVYLTEEYETYPSKYALYEIERLYRMFFTANENERIT